ncbi:MAG TPA: aminotransferase class III-fold pyridoxal phosphate-dependent enzyme [Oscillospiraceae bacterium]|nr:aminotransferase class III-fold pyridoxal phosphate-dependent enzyme [Oscillospiraceae bacterium]
MDIRELDKQYIADTYARYPVTLLCGKGALAYDDKGKEYIDMGAGIGVNAFGYADPVWLSAVIEQASTLQHVSNLYYTAPAPKLAELLCQKTGMKKAFFCNSGAEANECLLKAARKYAAGKKGAEYSTVLTIKNSFHGRTLTTLAATGQEHYHELYAPLTPGFVYAQAGDIHGVMRLCQENKVAAVFFECIQGEGGVIPLSREFVQDMASFAAEEDILVCVDEVQTGNGRTGALYSYMNYGITPDLVSTAKGLAGGLPIGACLMGEKVRDVFAPGDNGSTFGANPVCCAAALSVVSRLDDDFLKTVREKGELLKAAFDGAPGVKSVSGMGLMLGLETEKPAAEVVNACLEGGVLCLTAKNKVRLLPPLNIPAGLLDKAAGIIKTACAE